MAFKRPGVRIPYAPVPFLLKNPYKLAGFRDSFLFVNFIIVGYCGVLTLSEVDFSIFSTESSMVQKI